MWRKSTSEQVSLRDDGQSTNQGKGKGKPDLLNRDVGLEPPGSSSLMNNKKMFWEQIKSAASIPSKADL